MLTFRPKKQKLTPLRVLVTSVLFMLWIVLIAPAHAQSGGAQFIVKLKNSVELSNAPSLRRLEKEGEFLADVMARNNVDATWLRAGSVGTHVMRWGSNVRAGDQQSMLNRLVSDPEVEFAIEDRPVRAFATPNDPTFANQWALRSTFNTAGAKFDQAWDIVRGSADVVVAVLDTGVVFETPDLMGRLLSGYDFVSDVPTANDGNGRDANAADPGNWISSADAQTSAFSGCSVKNSSWHGTFVAGQIAANTHSDSDVAGADWNVKVLPVRVLGKCGGLLSDVLDAMLWSAGLDVPGIPRNPNPADVINLSLGSPTTCSSFEQTVVDRVNAAGTLVVAAAGNSGGSVDSPANCNNVLSVGALDRDGSRASYSAIGTAVSLMAPGGFSNGLVGLGCLILILPRGLIPRWTGITLIALLVLPPPRPEHHDFWMTLMDVGQGTAISIQTQNHLLIYDAGPAFNTRTDSARRVVLPWMAAHGYRRADMFMLSHDDADHSGGAPLLLQKAPPVQFASSINKQHSLNLLAQTLKSDTAQCHMLKPWTWDGVTFTPIGLDTPAHSHQKLLAKNNQSCVLKVSNANHSVLLTGDIEAISEMALLTQHGSNTLKSRVLIVPHHGSKTSSTMPFLQAVRPEYALIQAGWENQHGHPHKAVIERYEAMGVQWSNTAQNGAMKWRFKHLDFQPEVDNAHTLRQRYWHMHESGAKGR